MSDKKQYINITPPFSVNKDVDGISNERAAGDFQVLKNYIPENDILRTREGITVFPHTPAITAPYDPLADPYCVMWLRHESNATVRDCEINGIDYMDMDVGTLTASNSTYFEGSGSGFYNAYVGSPQLRKLTTLLPSGFPACDSDEGYIITFFVKLDWFPSAGEVAQIIVKEGVAGGSDINGQINFSVVRSAGWSYAKPKFICYDGLGASTDLEAEFSMFNDAWVAIWASKVLNLMGIRVRKADNTGSIVNTTYAIVDGVSTNRDASRRLKLGSNNILGKFRGYVDDFICIGSDNMQLLNTEAKVYEKIDSIFDRLF